MDINIKDLDGMIYAIHGLAGMFKMEPTLAVLRHLGGWRSFSMFSNYARLCDSYLSHHVNNISNCDDPE